jgi:glucokinase
MRKVNSGEEKTLQKAAVRLQESMPLFLGVDIGGTNTKLGLVNSSGQIVARQSNLTSKLENPNRVCDFIFEAGQGLAKSAGTTLEALEGIGVAVPGILDMRNGVLKELSNLIQWIEFPLRDELTKRFNRSVVVLNDASAAAFGEYSHRAMQNDSLALITLGTGVGGGIVIQGEPLGGDHGCAGEIGHAVIDASPTARMCGCGKRGHLEAYTGSFGVVKTVRDELDGQDESSLLRNVCLPELTPEIIAVAAERGDYIAQKVVQTTATYLGVGLSILCHCLDPSVVLLGGAMTFGQNSTATGRAFLKEIVDTVQRYSLQQIGTTVRIEFAALGGDAGILGAAAYARRAAAVDSESR